MSRSTRKSASPARPLLKAPIRIGALDTAALVARVRQLHEEAEDINVHRMPADEELFGALLYLEAQAGALREAAARREAALTRVRLWEYLREQADLHQAKAIEDARVAGVEWAMLAPALAVSAPSGAYNKATRLRAAVPRGSSGGSPLRRTPEAVLTAERQAVAQAAADRREAVAAAQRHVQLVPVARALLQHRAGLDDQDEVTYWLDEIEAVLPNCRTAIQVVSLETYVKAALRELRKQEHGTKTPPGRTQEAGLAYKAAADYIAGL
ncbi:hypothetical protein [Streptomyces tauricus]|uniref:hypothetical protein n=1 Tax=Streptomyces tauricus TaxID=68274 RepID=UPI002244ED8F|nr:hypothetical protein [Streptomyces tauricus]MCW8101707.1 hypothetical protein [Streptomyces tauricus]